jgi:tRNA-2-methylthio-N6-dimethylallyladenosine synthase
VVDKIRRDRVKTALTEPSPDVLTGLGGHYENSIKGQIAITRGCNRFCSYCIVPYVRGRELSRPAEDIIAEAKTMVANGTREILLLGQNVAAYGLNGDIRPPAENHSPFAELLEELEQIPELLRIRFTSPYPSYFNKRLIETIAKSDKICHNIHLPLQSGSDRVLKAMNRQYTNESYRAKVAELKSAISDLTLSTDVIVGFPGETDEDFALTRELMNDVGFEQSYIFKYSPRPGAKSAEVPDSVSESVKEERNQILLEDLSKRIIQRLEDMVGTTVTVLTEGVSARNSERWTGRTDNNIVVHFEPDADIVAGTLRQVTITRSGGVSLFGKLV